MLWGVWNFSSREVSLDSEVSSYRQFTSKFCLHTSGYSYTCVHLNGPLFFCTVSFDEFKYPFLFLIKPCMRLCFI